jgi:hypothetical protein
MKSCTAAAHIEDLYTKIHEYRQCKIYSLACSSRQYRETTYNIFYSIFMHPAVPLMLSGQSRIPYAQYSWKVAQQLLTLKTYTRKYMNTDNLKFIHSSRQYKEINLRYILLHFHAFCCSTNVIGAKSDTICTIFLESCTAAVHIEDLYTKIYPCDNLYFIHLHVVRDSIGKHVYASCRSTNVIGAKSDTICTIFYKSCTAAAHIEDLYTKIHEY